jgi:hypothetical protein
VYGLNAATVKWVPLRRTARHRRWLTCVNLRPPRRHPRTFFATRAKLAGVSVSVSRNVGFGSEADLNSAPEWVCFVPEADIDGSNVLATAGLLHNLG